MIGLELELLGGRYVATAYNDREQGEWPPHPARLFSALVDTWASDEPGSLHGEEERMALVWLERQAPPELCAAGKDEVAWRTVAPVFVPVNDTEVVRSPDGVRAKLAEAEEQASAGEGTEKERAKAAKELDKLRKKLGAETAKAVAAPTRVSASDLQAAARIFPEQRGKQARFFPSVTPADPRVTFLWAGEPEPTLVAALERLASRLTRLGHSASLVAARVVREAPAPRYRPDPDGEHLLRAVAPGQLERLGRAHALHQGVEPRVLPCIFVPYREGDADAAAPVPASSLGDDWIVLARAEGPRLPSTSAVGVATQLRRALFAAAKTPLPETLTGHNDDGGATKVEHLAIVPLPDVGGRYSHGGILGVALVPPRGLGDADRRELLRAVAALERVRGATARSLEVGPPIELLLGEAGVLTLERVAWGEHGSVGLRPRTWCRPWHDWATVTPIALDRNPGDLHDPDADKRARAFDDATEQVAKAVARLGLPRPLELEVSRSCLVAGTAKPRAFPRFPISRERPQRVLVHARLVFGERVRGPIVLGAGRYLGLGLCRPLDPDRPARGPTREPARGPEGGPARGPAAGPAREPHERARRTGGAK